MLCVGIGRVFEDAVRFVKAAQEKVWMSYSCKERPCYKFINAIGWSSPCSLLCGNQSKRYNGSTLLFLVDACFTSSCFKVVALLMILNKITLKSAWKQVRRSFSLEYLCFFHSLWLCFRWKPQDLLRPLFTTTDNSSLSLRSAFLVLHQWQRMDFSTQTTSEASKYAIYSMHAKLGCPSRRINEGRKF